MRLVGIPTRLLSQLPRSAITAGQQRLSEAQAEASTGRRHDIGLALGAGTGTSLRMRIDLDGFETRKDLAQQAGIRAGITQSALSSLSDLAQAYRSALSGARGAENGKNIATTAAGSSLQVLQQTLAASYDGQHVFSGLNSQVPPLAEYDSGPRQAIISAFAARFGFAPSDPAATALTPAQISDFLDTDFADLFSDAAWTSLWSNATNETPVFRLDGGEGIDLSASANEPFARALAKAFSMMDVLGQGQINRAVFQTIADRAMSLVSIAQVDIGNEQSRIGVGEARVKADVQSIEQTATRLSSAVQALEGVDPYEAAARVNTLMTQLEASYALTGRMSRMSLLSYI